MQHLKHVVEAVFDGVMIHQDDAVWMGITPSELHPVEGVPEGFRRFDFDAVITVAELLAEPADVITVCSDDVNRSPLCGKLASL